MSDVLWSGHVLSTRVSCAKMAETIVTQFGRQTRVGSRNHIQCINCVLHPGVDLTTVRGTFEVRLCGLLQNFCGHLLTCY